MIASPFLLLSGLGGYLWVLTRGSASASPPMREPDAAAGLPEVP